MKNKHLSITDLRIWLVKVVWLATFGDFVGSCDTHSCLVFWERFGEGGWSSQHTLLSNFLNICLLHARHRIYIKVLIMHIMLVIYYHTWHQVLRNIHCCFSLFCHSFFIILAWNWHWGENVIPKIIVILIKEYNRTPGNNFRFGCHKRWYLVAFDLLFAGYVRDISFHLASVRQGKKGYCWVQHREQGPSHGVCISVSSII